ncbi:MAG: hypothetical protein ACTSVB_04380 [Candidatus Heimdallarchaeaceae archaeon]
MNLSPSASSTASFVRGSRLLSTSQPLGIPSESVSSSLESVSLVYSSKLVKPELDNLQVLLLRVIKLL